MSDREEDLIALLSRAAMETVGHRLEGIDLDTRLVDFGMDSVGVLEMVGYVEDRLGLRFPDDEIMRLATVRDVATLVERARLRAEAAG
jgi:acyl carrier protein